MVSTEQVRVCKKCGVEKTLKDFTKGRPNECRVCYAKRQRDYRLKHPGRAAGYVNKWMHNNREQYNTMKRPWRAKNRDKLRSYSRKLKYGLTQEEYEALVKKQNGLCAICGNPPTGKRPSLCVDHCHVTGKIRGLLCGVCNTGIGHLRESIEILEKAIQYLKSHLA